LQDNTGVINVKHEVASDRFGKTRFEGTHKYTDGDASLLGDSLRISHENGFYKGGIDHTVGGNTILNGGYNDGRNAIGLRHDWDAGATQLSGRAHLSSDFGDTTLAGERTFGGSNDGAGSIMLQHQKDRTKLGLKHDLLSRNTQLSIDHGLSSGYGNTNLRGTAMLNENGEYQDGDLTVSHSLDHALGSTSGTFVYDHDGPYKASVGHKYNGIEAKYEHTQGNRFHDDKISIGGDISKNLNVHGFKEGDTFGAGLTYRW
jgi:hypothetical protein